LRYPYADYELIRFLYHLRKQNKQRKILIEFPTFPYAKELEGDQELLSIDRFFASFISPFVSHAFSFTNVSKIYGIPTTPVANGITPEEIPIRQYKIPAENRLQLLAVANISTWHGLDRVIEGIHIDLKKHNRSSILFHVVGEGIERNRLEELVCQFGLKKHVIFHGVQTGDALNQFFDQCDLAVGSLGMHRIGLSDASPLKAREYCCRGIPFIIAYQDPSFVNSPFVKVFPATDQAVSMDECRLFLEELRTKKCGSQEIRKHAEIQLSWSTTIQPIIKFCS
jgi:hypothetical protein